MTTETSLAVHDEPQQLLIDDRSPGAHLFDTARFEQMHRIAQVMACASLCPTHLKRNKPEETLGNCFWVVNQAVRWQMDPFAIAPETYVVQNKLGFQGKLVAAVVNARANLESPLSYTFDGTGESRRVTVHGKFRGEPSERTVDVALKTAKTSNKMWTSDPDQKLIYTGATKWARRHCPEIILGVLTDDDLDRIGSDQPASSGSQQRTRRPSVGRLTQSTSPTSEAVEEGSSQEESIDGNGDSHAVPTVDPTGAHAPLPAADRLKWSQQRAAEETAKLRPSAEEVRAAAKASDGNSSGATPSPTADKPATAKPAESTATSTIDLPGELGTGHQESLSVPCSPQQIDQIKLLLPQTAFGFSDHNMNIFKRDVMKKQLGVDRLAELTREKADVLISSLQIKANEWELAGRIDKTNEEKAAAKSAANGELAAAKN